MNTLNGLHYNDVSYNRFLNVFRDSIFRDLNHCFSPVGVCSKCKCSCQGRKCRWLWWRI